MKLFLTKYSFVGTEPDVQKNGVVCTEINPIGFVVGEAKNKLISVQLIINNTSNIIINHLHLASNPSMPFRNQTVD